MKPLFNPILIGDTAQKQPEREISGEFVDMPGDMAGDRFYRIRNYDAIEPFFMSLVSSSDHWLFISSSGGLSAGRVSAEQALFPYYTVDKLTENSDHTGNKAILLVTRPGGRFLWEPFSERQRGLYRIQRNLYKNVSGSTLIFEEVNFDLDLTYQYAWRTSDRYGFVKTTWLRNGEAGACTVELVDGLQNLLPANISSQTQNTFSVLLDAYKRSELDPETGLGLFTLSSNLTDLAEPSESLLATTVAQVGLEQADILLSTQQVAQFRCGRGVIPEQDVRGRRAAYLVHTTLQIEAGGQRSWHLIADVGQDHAGVRRLLEALRGEASGLSQAIEADVAANQARLMQIVASADGLQLTQDALCTSYHFANVLFNVLRGGVFADGDWIQTADWRDFIAARNPAVLREQADFLGGLPERIDLLDLQSQIAARRSADLARLGGAYLPLIFSRRHGDPSRPWNRFRINIKKPDGSLRFDYEGNWRDIFQNWEALAWSYPEFTENMLGTFLNATTVDGYNPYRITRDGVDWEQPEPGNPWMNIGYWSDHQIIYLQKLMEVSARVHPGALQQLLARPIYSYANVPYRIKPYADLLKDAYSTIDFDWEEQRSIDERVQRHGTDGKLVFSPDGGIALASLAEKLLTLLLAKLVNFVPEGGIWMNTQRPEWNDANNALVGKGLSVVTLCYLRRTLVFCRELFASSGLQAVPVRQEVASFCFQVEGILSRFRPVLAGAFSDQQRREMMDALGQAGSDTRRGFYEHGLSGKMEATPVQRIGDFLKLAQEFIEHTLRANKRDDNLYHSYNILHLHENGVRRTRAAISHLYEMLEGQVAMLSSGLLSAREALALLDSMRAGPLYQADQHSYLLYPDRALPGFLKKNCIPPSRVRALALVQALTAAQDKSLILQDSHGDYHFNGSIRNIKDVNQRLAALGEQSQFAGLAAEEAQKIRVLFEEEFHHNEFTGRSGTFFAYEGLGSIYWHMVSKLLLAVQETALRARNEPGGGDLSQALAVRTVDIRRGLGFHKPPEVYGAFPTDPYSHTPKGQGAKQPGMTGQVKEGILARQAELGLSIRDGRMVFDPFLLDPKELLIEPAIFSWLDTTGEAQSMELPAGSLAYTFCQTPIILRASDAARIEVHGVDGGRRMLSGNVLDATTSQQIFRRSGKVHHLCVDFVGP